MAIINVNKENFQKEVLEAKEPVLIDLWASWCGPCRMLAPILEQVAQERPDLKICKINVDEEPELANRFNVISIPLVVVVENGQVIKQSVGVKPAEAILQMLDE